MEEARQYISRADRLWPYDTVRSHYPHNPSSSVVAVQIRSHQDGLRLAGERDHADEDADFGVPTDGVLHGDIAGFTPKDAPGARTIRTADLSQFVAEARPVVIDTVSYTWDVSIPGAVGLTFAGLGGGFTDSAQDHLRSKMRELTGGNLSKPIVAVGWNSERFDGRNLALRLVALGYTQVYMVPRRARGVGGKRVARDRTRCAAVVVPGRPRGSVDGEADCPSLRHGAPVVPIPQCVVEVEGQWQSDHDNAAGHRGRRRGAGPPVQRSEIHRGKQRLHGQVLGGIA